MSATLLESSSLPAPTTTSSATRTRWASRIVSGAAVLFLAVDAVGKFVAPPPVVDGTLQLGFARHHLPILGAIELACLVLYLVPRTAVLGAVLFTGYFGGAIATHLRLDNPLLSHTLFPTYVAALLWVGLYLRDARVRALVRPAR